MGRELTLRDLDFEVDEGEALWQRWFLELQRRVAAGQAPAALPCGSADDFMLHNWWGPPHPLPLTNHKGPGTGFRVKGLGFRSHPVYVNLDPNALFGGWRALGPMWDQPHGVQVAVSQHGGGRVADLGFSDWLTRPCG